VRRLFPCVNLLGLAGTPPDLNSIPWATKTRTRNAGTFSCSGRARWHFGHTDAASGQSAPAWASASLARSLKRRVSGLRPAALRPAALRRASRRAPGRCLLIAGSISNVPCSGNGPLRAASSLPVSCRNGRLPVRRAKCVRMKEFPPGSKRDPCCVRPMCTGSNKNRPGFQISDPATLNADPICLRIRHEAEPAESQGSLGCQLLSRHKAEKSQGKKT
jgi:hypothetical protein